MGHRPEDRSETNQLWRDVEAEERAARAARCHEADARLADLQAAGLLTYQRLNGETHHLRVTCGRQVVDLWPGRGRWQVVGERGRPRRDGLPAVLRYLGVS